MAFLVSEYDQGAGNPLAQTTLHMMKYSPAEIVQTVLMGNFITTARGDNQQIYDTALARLGFGALISSNITRLIRY